MPALIRWSSVAVLVFILAVGVHARTKADARAQTPPPQTQAKPGAPQAPPTEARPGATQAPARDTKVRQTGTATIKGRVVGSDNGAPLRRARLVLSAPGLERPFYAATDGQGRYEFTDLPASRYTL